MKIKIYVEGGGEKKDPKHLRTQCRKAFSEFFKKAGFDDRMPAIVACGSRDQAFRDFQKARISSDNSLPILLVDSEESLKSSSAWKHLEIRDEWSRPDNVDDDQVHLMVQCMESWFMADKESLEKYFGSKFNANALPKNPAIEKISKRDVAEGLKSATRQCRKGSYDKGKHSFEIVECLNPNKVRKASPFADRLIKTLDNRSST